MKILLVDTGLSIAVALRLADEGNKVFYYSTWEASEPRDEDILIGRGILDDHKNIERVDNWHPYVDKVDLIVFNDIYFGEEVDALLKAGYKVIGTRPKGVELEADRTAPRQFKHLNFPPMKEFNDVQKAIEYVENTFEPNDRVVVKLSGFLRGSYVSHARDDAIDYIADLQEKAEGSDDVSIIVQKFIQGVEVAVGVWVSQHFPLLQFGWNMNFEHKRKCPGDVGPSTGEMGTVVFWADVFDVNKLVRETLTPMSSWLRKNYGNQYFDWNLIVEEQTGKVYLVEATSRWGYPFLLITLPLIQSDFGSLLWSMASGQETEVKYDTRIAVGIGINMAGYPFDCAMEKYYHRKFRVLYPEDESQRRYLVPAAVYRKKGDKENEYRVVPSHGRTFVAVGVGDNLLESQYKAIELAERVLLPDATWRYDIGDRLFSQAPILLQYGYLSTERYYQMLLRLP